jgi:uncharacterized protein
MIKRSIEKSIADQIGKFPVIAITGPRQSGKTTLIKKLFPNYRYVNLEDPDLRTYALQDTRAFLKEYDHEVIFDEAQRVPDLFSYLQNIVDTNLVMGQFVLSGSQNFLLLDGITQSLAGRVAIFELYPFDFMEMQDAKLMQIDMSTLFTRGFYPPLLLRGINPDRYYNDYIRTYLKRDIANVKNIQDEKAFSNFLKLCAARAGNVLNYSDLARDAGISSPTAKAWLSLLQSSYIIYLINPYFENFNKRIVKSSKLYFYDTGLLTHLLGVRHNSIKPGHPFWGSVFENMIVSELVKQNSHYAHFRDYYFWRDSEGNEVDLMFKEGDTMHLYEMKASTTLSGNTAMRGIELLESLQSSDTLVKKKVIHGGDSNQKRKSYEYISWKNVK